MVLLILWIILSGLVIGALARLVIPGPNPMSIPMTILVGIGGSIVGGLIGRLLFGRPGGIILAVLCSALLVWLISRSQSRRRTTAI
ncbi:MAG TPA: GlsB/YeaQ/YmgE family stress response membrane protein [Acidimicrobiales bacterium]|nr:GlsB/YeaQ/YmgE family stress response membrane protein [Acidimicrobiales bacterium]